MTTSFKVNGKHILPLFFLSSSFYLSQVAAADAQRDHA
jgi:hypothetical protein